MCRARIFARMSVLTAVVLAAGDATRMRSSRPKVLHPLCGRPLIEYPLNAASSLDARIVVVVGRDAEEVSAAVTASGSGSFVEQKERLGTGHALLQARGPATETADVLL